MATRLTTRMVVAVGLALLWGCAASNSSKRQLQGPQPDALSPQQQAAQKFDAWSRNLEKVSAGEAIEPNKLRLELDEILQIDADYTLARYNLAVLDAHAGNVGQAEHVFAQLAKSHPDFAPAVENVAASWVLDPAAQERAEKVYQQLIAAQPKNQTSRLALARLELSHQQYAHAIVLCREVLARQADAIEAFRILAACYLAMQDASMAELIVSRGLRIEPKDPELHETLAQVFLKRGETTRAIAKLKELVAMAPNRLSARAQLAQVAQSFFDYGNAAQQYEAILLQKPGFVPAQINLAVAYKSLGRFQEADDLYAKVLSEHSENLSALWGRGVLNQRYLAHYDVALASLTEFERKAPKDTFGVDQVHQRIEEVTRLKNDAQAQAEREAKAKARQAAVAAICAAVDAHQPVDTHKIGSEAEIIEAAWQQLAEAQNLAQNNNIAGAKRTASCAFAIVPRSPAADTQACAPMHVAWTRIAYQLGDLEEAEKSIQAALVCDGKNPDALLIADQLKQLRQQQTPPAQTKPR